MDHSIHTHRNMAARNLRTYIKVYVHKLLHCNKCVLNSNVKTTEAKLIKEKHLLQRFAPFQRNSRKNLFIYSHLLEPNMKLELVTWSRL